MKSKQSRSVNKSAASVATGDPKRGGAGKPEQPPAVSADTKIIWLGAVFQGLHQVIIDLTKKVSVFRVRDPH